VCFYLKENFGYLKFKLDLFPIGWKKGSRIQVFAFQGFDPRFEHSLDIPDLLF